LAWLSGGIVERLLNPRLLSGNPTRVACGGSVKICPVKDEDEHEKEAESSKETVETVCRLSIGRYTAALN
jgi:hypothetical protein